MLRKVLFVLFMILVVIAAGIAIFIMTFDLNSYKRFAEQKLSEMLNRPVQIESMETKLALVPTIKIKGLQIANPETLSGEKESLFRVNEMEATLELVPLLSSNVKVHQITVKSAALHFINKKGANNWTFDVGDKKVADSDTTKANENKSPDSEKNFGNIRLDTIDIDSFIVSYEDDEKKQEIHLKNVKVQDFHVLTGELVYQKQVIKIDLNTGRLEDFLNQKPNFAIDLKASLNRATVRLNGKIGDLKQLNKIQLMLTLSIPNVSSFARSFDIKSKYIPSRSLSFNSTIEGNLNAFQIKRFDVILGKKEQFSLSAKGKVDNLRKSPYLTLSGDAALNDDTLSQLWGIKGFSSEFQIGLNNQKLTLTKLNVEANRSDIATTGHIEYAKNPMRLSLSLSSQYFRVEDFIKQNTVTVPNKKNGKTANVQKASTKDTELPWELLSKVDGTIKLSFKNMPISDDIKQYAQLNAVATLSNGAAKVPFEAKILEGDIKGVVTLNGKNTSMEAQIQGRDLKLDDIRQMAKNVQGVRLDTDISLLGKGKTTEALLNNLNGQIVAELSEGFVINELFVKLPQIWNIVQKRKNDVTYSVSENRVPLSCGAANLNVKNGVILSKEQMALETDVLNFVVDGSADLAKQMLDVSMIPSLNTANKNINAALATIQVIHITGPFNDPSVGLDVGKPAKNLLQAGLKVLADSDSAGTIQGMLCSKALGGYQMARKKAVKQKPQVKAVQTQTPTKVEPKKEFKQQLIESLTKAIQVEAEKRAH